MYEHEGNGCITMFAVIAVLGLFAWFLIIMFGGTASTPEGYIDVGNHISYKCDHSTILWWDDFNHHPLNPTSNDGRCHA